MDVAKSEKDAASFSISSHSDLSSLNVYLAEDGGDKTPDVSFNNSFGSVDVEKEEILRIFHKGDRLEEGVNEISGEFCEKLITKNISENLTNEHYLTKFNTNSTAKYKKGSVLNSSSGTGQLFQEKSKK